jgi:hypothetical protein
LGEFKLGISGIKSPFQLKWTHNRYSARFFRKIAPPSNPDGHSMTDYTLTHLKQLEAESIHIIREVAAEFEKPVMLYSIGKDSAVMLHLTMKAFILGFPRSQ